MVRLPSGFQELTYIESTGTQWIDTGIAPFDGVVANFNAFIPHSMSTRTLFGTGGDDGWGVYMGQSNLWDDYNDDQSISISSGYTGSITVVKNGKKSTFTTSSGTINYTHSSTYPKDTRTISLFRKNGSTRSYGIFQLFLFSLSDQNGDFLWLGVPCKRLFDGAIGMYDLVSQSFFGNSGTGSFIAGMPVLDPIIPTRGSGLAQVTQKELLARRFAITPRKLWLIKKGVLQNGITLTNKSISSLTFQNGYVNAYNDGASTGYAVFSNVDFSSSNRLRANVSVSFSLATSDALDAPYTAKFIIRKAESENVDREIIMFSNRPASLVDRYIDVDISGISGMESIELYISGGWWRWSNLRIIDLWLE